MSSNIFVEFPRPLDLTEWKLFCAEHNIVHSPNTVGGNVYYCGQIQIVFGQSGFAKNSPTNYAKATFGTYFRGTEMGDAARLALAAIERFEGVVTSAAPEYRRYLLDRYHNAG